MNPIRFALDRNEIDRRLDAVRSSELTVRPHNRSVNMMLNSLSDFQKAKDVELLEWRPKEEKLYMLEPSFLFFLRWRRRRSRAELQRLPFSIIFDELKTLTD